jgi:hypothetical protein
MRSLPLLADIVAKVENRATPKISQTLIFADSTTSRSRETHQRS